MAPAIEPPMPKLEQNSAGRREKFCSKEVGVSVVLSLLLPPGAHVYI